MSNLKSSKQKMKKNLEDKSTFGVTLEALKVDKRGFGMNLFWFALLTIACLCLAYVAPDTLILTVPFVIIPSYFSFGAINTMPDGKFHENGGFFGMFRQYFSNIFFGGYRVIIGFLKSLLVYVFSESIVLVIFEYTLLNKDAEYKAFLENAKETTDIDAILKESNNLLNNEAFMKAIFFASCIAFALALLTFVHHISRESIKMKRNFFNKQMMSMRQFTLVDKKVKKTLRKSFNYDYFRGFWFIFLIELIAAAGGIAIGYFALRDLDIGKTIVITIFLVFLSILPLFNYISKAHDVMYLAYAGDYEETFVKMTLEFLNQYKDKLGMKEEDAKKIEDMLNEQKKMLDEKKDKDKKEDKK